MTLPIGIHPGVDFEEYLNLPYVSTSYLKKLDKCPALAKIEEDDDTAAKKQGRMIHTLTLEGIDSFNKQYLILPSDFPSRPTSREVNAKSPRPEVIEAESRWQALEQVGKVLISAAEFKELQAISAAVNSHPFAGKLLAEGVSEQTCIFDHKIGNTTIRCKCRPDKTPSPEYKVLVDLKSTANADKRAFRYDCFKFGYFIQAAFYVDGYNLSVGADDAIEDFVFIAVEKKPPYRTEVYVVPYHRLDWGRTEYLRLLRTEAECRVNNFWPHYTNPGADELSTEYE